MTEFIRENDSKTGENAIKMIDIVAALKYRREKVIAKVAKMLSK